MEIYECNIFLREQDTKKYLCTSTIADEWYDKENLLCFSCNLLDKEKVFSQKI